MSPAPVITVDGPSGSGKGTVGKRLTRRLGWHFLDSGTLYRLAGLAAQRDRLDPGDPAHAQSIARLAASLNVVFRTAPGGRETILMDGEDVTAAARSEAGGNLASRVAVLGPVRLALLGVQRRFRRSPGLVADGRDMGTVVFPDAALKLFLTASAEERARRRFNQLKELGMGANLERIYTEIQRRDERDRGREHAPLLTAVGAVVLDTTGLTVDEVVDLAMTHVATRRLAS